MGNEHHDTYSIDKYKGFEFGQKIHINGNIYSIYRIDDISNEITLISRHTGFGYIDIDKLIEVMDK